MKESTPNSLEHTTTQPERAGLPWHARSAAELISAFGTDLAHGLSPEAASDALTRIGPNTSTKVRHDRWWEEVAEALTEPLVLLLIVVGVLYAILGEVEDAVTILLVILAVAAIEVANETRAKRAIASLRTLSAPTATAVRGGVAAEVPAADLVPGDLLLLQPGDRVPADLRLAQSVAMRVDESSLTGESAPVAKDAGALLQPATELGDRRNLAFAGTLVTAGKGRGVVIATGMATELGRIVGLTQAARDPRTPLQRHLRQLAGWLVWVALGLSALVPALGVLVAGRPPTEMLLTGLTLAFATVPEELPILITIVLGIGAFQLARRQAIVKRLQAAETLGSVSVVGTDKTGTLTENRMRLAELFIDGAARAAAGASEGTAARLLEIGVLANDTQVSRLDGEVSFAGDPTEIALLTAAEEVGIGVAGVRAAARVLDERPFDDVRKQMSVVYERDGARWLAAKGAPEAILATCSSLYLDGRVEPLDPARRALVHAAAEQMAERGLRVLAFAERRLGADAALGLELDADAGCTLVGLAGLDDPPRPEVPGAIATLQAAGVRVLMLTGDHPATARAIANRVGIDAGTLLRGQDLESLADPELAEAVKTVSVFARISPAHKLRIVRALQARGDVVAVTGDGVNDAPALREAAIGVAMGLSGTDIAREAADLVLADDNFATVTAAVGAGRRLYANLRKAVRYYLAAKVALVTASLVAVLTHLPVPFEPVQIILMELFMDLGASVTFTAEPPEGDLMARPPRDPRRPFMDRSMQAGIITGGLSLAVAVLVSYWWAWSQRGDATFAQTVAFIAWMVGHVVLAAHMRAERQPLLRTSPLANRPFLLWATATLVVLVLGTTAPLLQARLHLADLPPAAWTVAIGAGLLLPSWWEIVKWAWWRWAQSPGRHE